MTYVRKTVEDVAHTTDEDLNEESIDYIQYKFESLINIMHLASDIHGVPQSFIDKLEEFVHCLDDFAKDFKNSNSSFIPGLLFTGSRGQPAFQISKDILQMFIDNKFTINSMAKMLQAVLARIFPCHKEILALARKMQGNKFHKEIARKNSHLKGSCKEFL